MSLTRQAHQLILDHAEKYPIKLAIDATCGNGHDTLFLSKISQRVLGFDVQEEAINNTTNLLENNDALSNVELFHKGHENIEEVLKREADNPSIDVAMFNLGYLPKGSDQSIVTSRKTTLSSLTQSINNLSSNGLICAIFYRGHEGGNEEFEAVLNELDTELYEGLKITRFDSSKPSEITPVLIKVIHSEFNH